MKRSLKNRVGLLLVIILFLLVVSCRVSKKAIDKSKESFESSFVQEMKKDSVIDSKKAEETISLEQASWSDYLKNFDFKFTGNSPEDKLIFEITPNGIHASGKGEVNYKANSSGVNSESVINKLLKSDEVTSVRTDFSNLVDSSSYTKSKVIDQDIISTGFNWNFTILLIVAIIISIVLFWKYGLPNNKK